MTCATVFLQKNSNNQIIMLIHFGNNQISICSPDESLKYPLSHANNQEIKLELILMTSLRNRVYVCKYCLAYSDCVYSSGGISWFHFHYFIYCPSVGIYLEISTKVQILYKSMTIDLQKAKFQNRVKNGF